MNILNAMNRSPTKHLIIIQLGMPEYFNGIYDINYKPVPGKFPQRTVLSEKLLMGSNTQRMFMSTCLCCRETFPKLYRKNRQIQNMSRSCTSMNKSFILSKVCDYLTHVSCVAPIIRTYHNHRCNCLPACDSRQFSIDRIQYGEMKQFRYHIFARPNDFLVVIFQ